MKNLSLTSLVLSTILAAQGAFANQGVNGTWKLPHFVSGPLTIDATLTFTSSSVKEIVVCSMQGESVSVEVTSPAMISSSQINILGTAQNEVNKDGIHCTASVATGSMSYSVSADDANLTLSAPGQPTMILPRQ